MNIKILKHIYRKENYFHVNLQNDEQFSTSYNGISTFDYKNFKVSFSNIEFIKFKRKKKENQHFNFSFISQGSSVSTLDSNTKKRVKTIFQCSIDKKGLLTNEVVHLLKKRKIIVKVQLKKKQLEYTR